MTDAGHDHTVTDTTAGGSVTTGMGGSSGVDWYSSTTRTTSSVATGISVATANANSGGNETRPKNAYVLYCIKY